MFLSGVSAALDMVEAAIDSLEQQAKEAKLYEERQLLQQKQLQNEDRLQQCFSDNFTKLGSIAPQNEAVKCSDDAAAPVIDDAAPAIHQLPPSGRLETLPKSSQNENQLDNGTSNLYIPRYLLLSNIL